MPSTVQSEGTGDEAREIFASSGEEEKAKRLVAMGFTAVAVQKALSASGGDDVSAVELLLGAVGEGEALSKKKKKKKKSDNK